MIPPCCHRTPHPLALRQPLRLPAARHETGVETNLSMDVCSSMIRRLPELDEDVSEDDGSDEYIEAMRLGEEDDIKPLPARSPSWRALQSVEPIVIPESQVFPSTSTQQTPQRRALLRRRNSSLPATAEPTGFECRFDSIIRQTITG